MMSVYVSWVTARPMLSAAVQFAILGTLGEMVASSLKRRCLVLPCKGPQIAAKCLAWALLGLVIKYGFTGMKGFTQTLLDKGMLPAFLNHGLGKAFAVSVLTNTFFGPQMICFHRIEDNWILGQHGFQGIQKAWWTLLWFWIPAHTLTFSLPAEYQIGLAAFWGLVLGILLGWAKPVPGAASSRNA